MLVLYRTNENQPWPELFNLPAYIITTSREKRMKMFVCRMHQVILLVIMIMIIMDKEPFSQFLYIGSDACLAIVQAYFQLDEMQHLEPQHFKSREKIWPKGPK